MQITKTVSTAGTVIDYDVHGDGRIRLTVTLHLGGTVEIHSHDLHAAEPLEEELTAEDDADNFDTWHQDWLIRDTALDTLESVIGCLHKAGVDISTPEIGRMIELMLEEIGE